MIEYLRPGIRHAKQQEALRRILGMGPWCWPDPADEARFDAAMELLPSGPPEVAPGHVLAITVCDSTTTLWRLGASRSDVPLAGQAVESWRAARLALPRALPVLWTSLNSALKSTPGAHRLDAWVRPNQQERLERVIDGPSAGLSLALFAASRVFNVPVPTDVVASAAVDAFGRVSPVAGLSDKLQGLRSLAPRVTRFIVAASQKDEAQDLAEGNFGVVGVSTVAQAFDAVFGESLVQALIDAGDKPERRAAIAESFFGLALKGRGELVDWTPIERGARLAAERWDRVLGNGDRFHLRFAEAVAARHEGNKGTIPVPPNGWLSQHPRPLRLAVMAHVTQHAADTGHPRRDSLEQPVNAELPHDLAEGCIEQWHLAGAWARLLAVTGDPDRAIDLQAEIAALCVAAHEPEDASFPLSEWFRLAGAMIDSRQFVAADEVRQRVMSMGGLRP